MSKPTWHSETRKITDLNPAPYNPRQSSEKEVQDIKNSVLKFGFVDPVIINLNNNIIGGHVRIKILQSEGIGTVEARIPDRLLTPEEEQELNLRLNKNQSRFDFDALANLDKDLLIEVGFSPEELSFNFDVGTNEFDDSNVVKKNFAICPECGHEFPIKLRKTKKRDKKDAE